MQGELYAIIKVIVYVTSFRVNESNLANFSQPETKNIMLKLKTQISQYRKRKLQFKTKNRSLRSEIAVCERNTQFLASYLKFREMHGFPIGNLSFRATYKIFTT